MSGKTFLSKAFEALEAQKFEEVKKLVFKYSHLSGQSLEDYYNWGRLAETVGLYDEALKLYQKALSFDFQNPQILLALGELYYLRGNYYKAFKVFKNLLKINESSEVVRLFLEILKKLRFSGLLLHWKPEKSAPTNLYDKNFQEVFLKKLLDVDLLTLLKHLQYLLRDISQFEEYQLDKFGNLYRSNSFQNLTLNSLREHLLGRVFISFLPFKENLSFSQFYLGIKYPSSFIYNHPNLESFLLIKSEEIKTFSLKISNLISNWGIKNYLERFHRFYYRIWFFLDEEVNLYLIKDFLKKLINELPFPSGGLVFEEGIPHFSLTEKAGLKLIQLPLGFYPYTFDRSYFLDKRGTPLENLNQIVRYLIPVSSKFIKNFVFSHQVSIETTHELKEKEELKILRNKCHLIDYLIKKTEVGKILSREEKLSLLLTIGFLKNGRNLVHQILSSSPDYSFSKVENLFKNLPSHPISCLKLELWLKEISSLEPCNCLFGEKTKERYPSPLLHLDLSYVPSYQDFTLQNLSLEKLILNYLKTKEKLNFLENLIKTQLKKSQIFKIKVEDYLLTLEDDKLEVIKP